MKKAWLLGFAVLATLAVKVWADGSFVAAPGPVVAATGQNYYYPAAASPTAGGQLVNDGSLTFRWTNTVVTSTDSLTTLQIPAFPLMTSSQIDALTPATTGQVVMCSNCSVYSLCVSTGIGPGAWSVVGSSAPTNSRIACQ